MKFNYQVRDEEGKIQSGIVEAPDKDSALELLQKQGFFITFLEKVSQRPFYEREIKFFNKVSRQDLVMFSRQLSIMVKSRVPLVEALQTLSSQIQQTIFKEEVEKLSEDVQAGSSFSQALSRYPEHFSAFFVNMVASGEASGKLSESLVYLADHLEREHHLRSKIKAAMMYPVFVLVVLFGVGSLMLFFVFPSLSEVLMQEGTVEDLPAITIFVFTVAKLLKTWGPLIVIFTIIGLIAIWYYLFKTEEGKDIFDKFSLKIPLLGGLSKKLYLSRFAENLSTLVAAGLPISQALEITANVIGSNVYKSIILDARDKVRRGDAISTVLAGNPKTIPPLVSQMVLVGERTGRLNSSLMNIVNFYQDDVDRSIDSLIGLLEPLLLIFLGIIVAALVLSVFVPLYKTIGQF